ncbi:hypothetical protein BB561_005202 [Smittium simulii]|uniref:Uncharacterized protein n=1 Tax=Smittium simulii TaxID=133385 RepID=A0A2T9YBF3_9FUNG|nr:hypothetical protein BB561_005202 [Smittium simulii]
MLFVPINLSDAEYLDEESFSDKENQRETETELKIDQGFKLFKNALALQYENLWSDSISIFENILATTDFKDIIANYELEANINTQLFEKPLAEPPYTLDNLERLSYLGIVKSKVADFIPLLIKNDQFKDFDLSDILEFGNTSPTISSQSSDLFYNMNSIITVQQALQLFTLLNILQDYSLSSNDTITHPLACNFAESIEKLLKIALSYFLNAVKIKKSDILSWICAGNCALITSSLDLAQNAYSNGLKNSFLTYSEGSLSNNLINSFENSQVSENITDIETDNGFASDFIDHLFQYLSLDSKLLFKKEISNSPSSYKIGPLGIWCLQATKLGCYFVPNFMNDEFCAINRIFGFSDHNSTFTESNIDQKYSSSLIQISNHNYNFQNSSPADIPINTAQIKISKGNVLSKFLFGISNHPKPHNSNRIEIHLPYTNKNLLFTFAKLIKDHLNTELSKDAKVDSVFSKFFITLDDKFLADIRNSQSKPITFDKTLKSDVSSNLKPYSDSSMNKSDTNSGSTKLNNTSVNSKTCKTPKLKTKAINQNKSSLKKTQSDTSQLATHMTSGLVVDSVLSGNKSFDFSVVYDPENYTPLKKNNVEVVITNNSTQAKLIKQLSASFATHPNTKKSNSTGKPFSVIQKQSLVASKNNNFKKLENLKKIVDITTSNCSDDKDKIPDLNSIEPLSVSVTQNKRKIGDNVLDTVTTRRISSRIKVSQNTSLENSLFNSKPPYLTDNNKKLENPENSNNKSLSQNFFPREHALGILDHYPSLKSQVHSKAKEIQKKFKSKNRVLLENKNDLVDSSAIQTNRIKIKINDSEHVSDTDSDFLTQKELNAFMQLSTPNSNSDYNTDLKNENSIIFKTINEIYNNISTIYYNISESSDSSDDYFYYNVNEIQYIHQIYKIAFFMQYQDCDDSFYSIKSYKNFDLSSLSNSFYLSNSPVESGHKLSDFVKNFLENQKADSVFAKRYDFESLQKATKLGCYFVPNFMNDEFCAINRIFGFSDHNSTLTESNIDQKYSSSLIQISNHNYNFQNSSPADIPINTAQIKISKGNVLSKFLFGISNHPKPHNSNRIEMHLPYTNKNLLFTFAKLIKDHLNTELSKDAKVDSVFSKFFITLDDKFLADIRNSQSKPITFDKTLKSDVSSNLKPYSDSSMNKSDTNSGSTKLNNTSVNSKTCKTPKLKTKAINQNKSSLKKTQSDTSQLATHMTSGLVVDSVLSGNKSFDFSVVYDPENYTPLKKNNVEVVITNNSTQAKLIKQLSASFATHPNTKKSNSTGKPFSVIQKQSLVASKNNNFKKLENLKKIVDITTSNCSDDKDKIPDLNSIEPLSVSVTQNKRKIGDNVLDTVTTRRISSRIKVSQNTSLENSLFNSKPPYLTDNNKKLENPENSNNKSLSQNFFPREHALGILDHYPSLKSQVHSKAKEIQKKFKSKNRVLLENKNDLVDSSAIQTNRIKIKINDSEHVSDTDSDFLTQKELNAFMQLSTPNSNSDYNTDLKNENSIIFKTINEIYNNISTIYYNISESSDSSDDYFYYNVNEIQYIHQIYKIAFFMQYQDCDDSFYSIKSYKNFDLSSLSNSFYLSNSPVESGHKLSDFVKNFLENQKADSVFSDPPSSTYSLGDFTLSVTKKLNQTFQSGSSEFGLYDAIIKLLFICMENSEYIKSFKVTQPHINRDSSNENVYNFLSPEMNEDIQLILVGSDTLIDMVHQMIELDSLAPDIGSSDLFNKKTNSSLNNFETVNSNNYNVLAGKNYPIAQIQRHILLVLYIIGRLSHSIICCLKNVSEYENILYKSDNKISTSDIRFEEYSHQKKNLDSYFNIFQGWSNIMVNVFSKAESLNFDISFLDLKHSNNVFFSAFLLLSKISYHWYSYIFYSCKSDPNKAITNLRECTENLNTFEKLSKKSSTSISFIKNSSNLLILFKKSKQFESISLVCKNSELLNRFIRDKPSTVDVDSYLRLDFQYSELRSYLNDQLDYTNWYTFVNQIHQYISNGSIHTAINLLKSKFLKSFLIKKGLNVQDGENYYYSSELSYSNYKKRVYILDTLVKCFHKINCNNFILPAALLELSLHIEMLAFCLNSSDFSSNDSTIPQSKDILIKIYELLEVIYGDFNDLNKKSENKSFLESYFTHNSVLQFTQLSQILNRDFFATISPISEKDKFYDDFCSFIFYQVGICFSKILSAMTSILPFYDSTELHKHTQLKKKNSNSNSKLYTETNLNSANPKGNNCEEILENKASKFSKQEMQYNIDFFTNRVSSCLLKASNNSTSEKNNFDSNWELVLTNFIPGVWLRTIIYGWPLIIILHEMHLYECSIQKSVAFISLLNNIHNFMSMFGLCSFTCYPLYCLNTSSSFKNYTDCFNKFHGGFCNFVLYSTRRFIVKHQNTIQNLINSGNHFAKSSNKNSLNRSPEIETNKSSNPCYGIVEDSITLLLKNSLLDTFSQAIFCLYDTNVILDKSSSWVPTKHAKTTGLFSHFIFLNCIDKSYANISNNHISKKIEELNRLSSINDLDIISSGIIYNLIHYDFIDAIEKGKLSIIKSTKSLLEIIFSSLGYTQTKDKCLNKPIDFNTIIRKSTIINSIIKNSIDTHAVNTITYNLYAISNFLNPNKTNLDNLLAILQSLVTEIDQDILSCEFQSKFLNLSTQNSFSDTDISDSFTDLDEHDFNKSKLRTPKLHCFLELEEVVFNESKLDIVLYSHKSAHLINAIMQKDTLRTRLNKHTNLAKNADDYTIILELLFIHLSFNPCHWENWCLLAKTLVERADALLLLTDEQVEDYMSRTDSSDESSIKNSYHTASINYHKKNHIKRTLELALLCYTQALNLYVDQPHKAYKSFDDNINIKSSMVNKRAECTLNKKLKYCTKESPIEMLYAIATLIYRMASSPISSKFYKKLHIVDKGLMNYNKNSHKKNAAVINSSAFYQTSIAFYTVLSNVINKNSSNIATNSILGANVTWQTQYMLGKSLAKIGMDNEACIMYLQSIHLANYSNSRKNSESSVTSNQLQSSSLNDTHFFKGLLESAIDPCMKLLSSITKLLYHDSICICIALKYLYAVPNGHLIKKHIDQNNSQYTSIKHIPKPNSKCEIVSVNQNDLKDDLDNCTYCKRVKPNVTKHKLYRVIIQCLKSLIIIDKKKWQHKPRYIIAWIYFYILKEYDHAKSSISKILNIRQSPRTLVNFFKPEFEESGKYYVYLEKYIIFSLKLCVVSCYMHNMENTSNKSTLSSSNYPTGYCFSNNLDFIHSICKKIVIYDSLYLNKQKIFKECRESIFIIILIQLNHYFSSLKYMKNTKIINQDLLSNLIQTYIEESKHSIKSNKSTISKISEKNIENVDSSIAIFLQFSSIINSNLDTREFDRLTSNSLTAFSELSLLVSSIIKDTKAKQKEDININRIDLTDNYDDNSENTMIKHQDANISKKDHLPPKNPNYHKSIVSSFFDKTLKSNDNKEKSNIIDLTNKKTQLAGSSDLENIDDNNSENDRLRARPIKLSSNKSNSTNLKKNFKVDSTVISQYTSFDSNIQFILSVYSEVINSVIFVNRLVTLSKKLFGQITELDNEVYLNIDSNNKPLYYKLEPTNQVLESHDSVGRIPTEQNNTHIKKLKFYLNAEFIEQIISELYLQILSVFGNMNALLNNAESMPLKKKISYWIADFTFLLKLDTSIWDFLIPQDTPSEHLESGNKASPNNSKLGDKSTIERTSVSTKSSKTTKNKELATSIYSKISKRKILSKASELLESVYNEKIIEEVLNITHILPAETAKKRSDHNRKMSGSSINSSASEDGF